MITKKEIFIKFLDLKKIPPLQLEAMKYYSESLFSFENVYVFNSSLIWSDVKKKYFCVQRLTNYNHSEIKNSSYNQDIDCRSYVVCRFLNQDLIDVCEPKIQLNNKLEPIKILFSFFKNPKFSSSEDLRVFGVNHSFYLIGTRICRMLDFEHPLKTCFRPVLFEGLINWDQNEFEVGRVFDSKAIPNLGRVEKNWSPLLKYSSKSKDEILLRTLGVSSSGIYNFNLKTFKGDWFVKRDGLFDLNDFRISGAGSAFVIQNTLKYIDLIYKVKEVGKKREYFSFLWIRSNPFGDLSEVDLVPLKFEIPHEMFLYPIGFQIETNGLLRITYNCDDKEDFIVIAQIGYF